MSPNTKIWTLPSRSPCRGSRKYKEKEMNVEIVSIKGIQLSEDIELMKA